MIAESIREYGYNIQLLHRQTRWLNVEVIQFVDGYVKYPARYRMPTQYPLLIPSPVHQISFDVVPPIDTHYSSALLISIDKHTL